MNNLFKFIKEPLPITENNKIKWEQFAKYCFYYMLFTFLIGITAFVLSGFHHIDHKGIPGSSIFNKFLIAIIVAPIFEEVIFRLWLKKRKYNSIITLTVIAGWFIYRYPLDSETLKIAGIVNGTIFFFVLLCILKPAIQIKYFRYLFYFSCLIFGLLHVTNFNNYETFSIGKTILYTLPQIFMAIIIGYFRMHNGFKYGLLFHATINFIGTIMCGFR